MAATKHYNLPTMATGAVDWPAIINDIVAKVEVGRTLKATAGETLAVGKAFYIKAADSKAYLATYTTGVAGLWQSSSTATGVEGFGQIGGIMTDATWTWTPGAYLFIDSSSVLTGTDPATGVRAVAYAISATEIIILRDSYSTLTPGSIPFVGSDGKLTQDNANLFWDASRLGIGTNTPGYTAEVIGTIGIRPNTNSGGFIVFDSDVVSVGGLWTLNKNDGTDQWRSGLRGKAGSLTNDLYFSTYSSGWNDILILSSIGIEVSGGARLNTATTKPTADATSVGTLWVTQGGAGVADVFEVCLKSAADAYSWKNIATG